MPERLCVQRPHSSVSQMKGHSTVLFKCHQHWKYSAQTEHWKHCSHYANVHTTFSIKPMNIKHLRIHRHYRQVYHCSSAEWNYSVRSTSWHCNIFPICLESLNIWQMFRAYSIVTYFINENDAGLNLDGQWEHSSSQLLRFAVPLVSQSGGLEINKAASRCFRCCFGN